MEKSFTLNVITPDRTFFSGDVQSLVVTTLTGEMGVLCHTLPIVTVLKAGSLRIKSNGRWMEACGGDGILSVTPRDATVLVQTCLWPHEHVEEGEADDPARQKLSAAQYRRIKAKLAAQTVKMGRD